MIRMLLMAMLLLVPATAAARGPQPVDAEVRRAFFFAYPVYQFAKTRAAAIKRNVSLGRPPLNTVTHRSRLSGPEDRNVTTPNNDTVYSTAWLDLSRGPVTLSIPALPGRYHSVALMDIFTDNFAILGTRDAKPVARTVWIAGPGWRGAAPAGAEVVRAPTNDVWLLVRTLVDGPADLQNAIAAQQRFTLVASQPVPGAEATEWPAQTEPREFLAAVNTMLSHGALPAERARLARSLSPAGIDVSGRDIWQSLSPAVRASWTRQLPALIEELKTTAADAGPRLRGWTYSKPNLGNFGTDDRYRSIIALTGLAALPPEEAAYATAVADSKGEALDGRKRYMLTIPAQIPVKGFWSLSMYRLEDDGQLFFTPNPLARYAIGNRTAGLKPNADGTITVRLQSTAPTDGSNWLPTPDGPFRMTFRAYLLRKGAQLRLPPVMEERAAR